MSHYATNNNNINNNNTRFHYAWLSSSDVWWDDEWGTPQNPRGPFFWRREDSLRALLRDEVVVDTYLDGALQKESEVMISSDLSPNDSVIDAMFSSIQVFAAKHPPSPSSWSTSTASSSSILRDKKLFREAIMNQGQLLAVAVPIIKESQLLEKLGVVPYSTQVPVRLATPMEAEDVRFSKNYARPLRDEYLSGSSSGNSGISSSGIRDGQKKKQQ